MALMRARTAESDDKVATVRRLLAARGMDARDFDIADDPRSGISQLLGLPGGVLTLRRRSTGEIRVYASGAGSAWFATISADLDRGYFRAATASRTRPSAGPPFVWWRSFSRAASAAAR